MIGVGGVANAPGKPVKKVPTLEEREAAKADAKAAEKARKEASDAKFLADTQASIQAALTEGTDPEDVLRFTTEAALTWLTTKLKAKLPRAARDRTKDVRRKAIIEAIREQRSAEGKA